MIFHDLSPKITEIKPKVNKWYLIKLIRFFTVKESIKKVKRQPSGWNKVIAKETIAELLISKLCMSKGKKGIQGERRDSEGEGAH